jgi:DNA polymerase III delta prime subunit
MIDNPKFDLYAPRCLSDIVGNNDTWAKLYSSITSDTASNLIIVGPPGCGKSLFLRFALSGHRVLNIECTANSGLRDVRDSIHIFAHGAKSCGSQLRWVVFEHADNLTSDTQAFLRRMLETTVETTRFVFECRDVGAISEPILSRAHIINISAPDDTEILYEIKRRSGFSIPDSIATEITALSFGNIRSAVLNTLAFKINGTLFHKVHVDSMLAARPNDCDINKWVKWAINTESECRNIGIDLRDILRLGWPNNPIVNNTCTTWSRLGGSSPRALFYDCVYRLVNAV